MEFVVPSHGNEGSPCGANRVKDLHGSLTPDLQLQKFVPLGNEVELESLDGTRQRDSTDEEDDQHYVREGGCQVHHLQAYNDSFQKFVSKYCHGGIIKTCESFLSTQHL